MHVIKRLLPYPSSFNNTRKREIKSEKEWERKKGDDSSNNGLGLDPLYNIFVVHCTTEMAVHTTHTLFEKVGRCIDLRRCCTCIRARTHLRAANTLNTQCNVGGSTGPKAKTRKMSAGAGIAWHRCRCTAQVHVTSTLLMSIGQRNKKTNKPSYIYCQQHPGKILRIHIITLKVPIFR